MNDVPRRLDIAIRAFPRRFRTARRSEFVSTFSESAEAGDAHPYGARAMIDVVRAGWTERLRTRPPLRTYLNYRLFGGRLDPRWHRWMLDDVRGWVGVRESALTVTLFIVISAFASRLGMNIDLQFVLLFATFTMAGGLLTTRSRRARILRRHQFDPETQVWNPPVAWAPLPPRPRRVVRVVPAGMSVAVGLTVVAPGALLASLGHVGREMGSVSRMVDHTAPVTAGAVVAAAVLTIATVASHRRLLRRAVHTIDPGRPDVVVAGTLRSSAVGLVIAVVGLVTCWLPLAPMVVPVAFVAATGAVPALVLVSRAARQQRPGTVAVWSLSPLATRSPTRWAD